MWLVDSWFFNDTATTEIYTYLHTLSLHDALPISAGVRGGIRRWPPPAPPCAPAAGGRRCRRRGTSGRSTCDRIAFPSRNDGGCARGWIADDAEETGGSGHGRDAAGRKTIAAMAVPTRSTGASGYDRGGTRAILVPAEKWRR